MIKPLPRHDATEHALLNTKTINQVPVNITAPAYLNVIKGVISHPEMAYLDSDEVLEMLDEQGVIHCHKQWSDRRAYFEKFLFEIMP